MYCLSDLLAFQAVVFSHAVQHIHILSSNKNLFMGPHQRLLAYFCLFEIVWVVFLLLCCNRKRL